MAAFAAVNTQARTGDRDGAHVGQVKSQFKRWKRISTVRGKQDNNPQKQRSVQEVDDEESDDMFLVLVNVSGRKFEVRVSSPTPSLFFSSLLGWGGEPCFRHLCGNVVQFTSGVAANMHTLYSVTCCLCCDLAL